MRILVVELADIGDLITATPALGALRESFPDARIDVLTTVHAAPILNGTGMADEVILFDKFVFDRIKALLKPHNLRLMLSLALQLRHHHYDAVLIFHRLTTRFGALKYAGLALATGAPKRLGIDNGRGWFLTHRVIDAGFGAKHQAEYWLEVAALLGAKPSSPPRYHVGVSEADQAWAAEQLPAGKRYIAIHPGSGGYSLARRWEPEKFAALADRFAAQGSQIVLVGGSGDDVSRVQDAMQAPVLNLAGKTTLNQLAAVLARCEHYYGADSGVAHIAAAADIPVTVLFGPSSDRAWRPFSPATQVIRNGTRCSPCSYIGNTLGLREGCAARTCMKSLTPEEVLAGRFTASTLAPESIPTISILGIPVHCLTFEMLLERIETWIAEKGAVRQICTVNPEFLMAAQQDSLFYAILKRADLCAADGVGLLWAAKRLGQALPERVTGSDGVPLIAERAAAKGWKLFFLGAGPGIADKAAAILKSRYPGLQIAGTYAGSPAADEEDAIVGLINRSGADIVFVAYGAPNQDKWIARNLHRFSTVKVAMGVGGSFDFIAGVTQRAPLWMRKMGIEWLHRLVRQPWRWRRMTRLPRFVFAVLLNRSRGPVRFETHVQRSGNHSRI